MGKGITYILMEKFSGHYNIGEKMNLKLVFQGAEPISSGNF